MQNTIRIKDIVIGEGAPKVIAPIVEKTRDDIVKKAIALNQMKIDAVEWRVDFYEGALDVKAVLDTLGAMRTASFDKPLLFTFRTQNEGGEKEITMSDYTALNKAVAESGYVDLIDVELFSGDPVVEENISNIQAANVFVVASSHEFSKTPEQSEIVARLCKMQDMGADILKIAVMPTCMKDVLTLLSATNEMYEKHADRPLVTMSMSSRGTISRLTGEIFGSAMTFGAVGQVSAPGQISVEKLGDVLKIIHDTV